MEHVDNNIAVRDVLTKRGIVPENLPPAEDVKKFNVNWPVMGSKC
jgi:DNA-damage-inducible protein D